MKQSHSFAGGKKWNFYKYLYNFYKYLKHFGQNLKIVPYHALPGLRLKYLRPNKAGTVHMFRPHVWLEDFLE